MNNANAIEIKHKIVDWTVKHSGFEDRRYLGFSQIHNCPLSLYRDLIDGRRWNTAHHLQCYAGYLWEQDIKNRLKAMGLYTPGSEREICAPWDPRFRGHTDGEIGGQLLEIKSVTQAKLEQIVYDQRIPSAHFEQVQCYLWHGGYSLDALVIYVTRDTSELHVQQIRPFPQVAERLDAKARAVLLAVDTRTPPRCVCGRCER